MKIVIFLFLLLPITARCEELRVVFLDIGEGDCTLVLPPKGSPFLIDLGNPRSGPRILSTLKRYKVNELSRVVFTHPHLDHFGGLFAVLPFVQVEKVFDNGEPLVEAGKREDIFRYYEQEIRHVRLGLPLKQGDTFQDRDLLTEVLWPPSPGFSADWNSNSLVLSLVFGKFRLLIMGDANRAVEPMLIAQDRSKLSATVLRLGHHGAEDASTLEFLRAVNPKAGIISVDKHNHRGYPSAETVERVMSLGIPIYRTDRHGTVSLTANKTGKFKINTERQ